MEMGERPALVIGFDTQELLTAAEMGYFLIAMQKDYERLYGIKLTVADTEIGSWWVKVIEWVVNNHDQIGDIAASGTRLFDFASRIANALRHKKKEISPTAVSEPDTLRVVEEAIKIAGKKKDVNFEIYREDCLQGPHS